MRRSQRKATIHRLEPRFRRNRLDELLDKVSEVGIDGLSEEERQELVDLSKERFEEKRN
jgi:hypothetical protein